MKTALQMSPSSISESFYALRDVPSGGLSHQEAHDQVQANL